MAKAKPKAERQHQMTQEELAEFSACSPVQGAAGFIRFCQKHVKIECKLTKTIIPFVLYDCQRDLAGKLVLGLWLIVLKARQLGITWLVSAYVVWRMTYDRFFSAVIVNQSKTYAQDFIGKKCKLIWENLPPFLRHQLRADTLTRLEFGDGQPDGHKAESNAVAGNSNAACSWTVVLAVYDEGARIADLQPARDAIEPALANVKGQAVIVSTSLGPSGDFYRYWKKAVKAEKARKVEEERTGEPVPHQPRVLVPIFYPWDAHPDRDEAWYAAEKAAHAEDPLYMPQNFPRTPDEAFMAAGGRIYPRLHPSSHQYVVAECPPGAKRIRAIDYGQSASAFVCLWMYHIPSDVPRLTYDPSCIHFEEEMLAYSWDPKSGEPLKIDDHSPDALRMGVATFMLDNWVHVYREYYVDDPVSRLMSTQNLCAGVKRLSGWELYDEKQNLWRPLDWAEKYYGTVFDRAMPILELDFRHFQISAFGHKPPYVPGPEKLPRKEEVRTGIAMVNKMVIGFLPHDAEHEKSPEDQERELANRPDYLRAIGVRSTSALDFGRRTREQARRRPRRSRRRLPM